MTLPQHAPSPPAAPAPLDFRRLADEAMWAAFAPFFHIADPAVLTGAPALTLPAEQNSVLQERLRMDGYFHVSDVDWGLDIPLMVSVVRALSAAGLPPVFAFLYDEFWLPFRKLAPLYRVMLGDYVMLPDFWVWDVDAKRGESGWKPHRDKGLISLFPNGAPKSLTCWIPLTPATPLSSCMYVVPAAEDRTYATAQENTHTFDMQSIRALPGKPGDFFVWNQAVLHWGSKASRLAPESRVSMAVEFQRRDMPAFNSPLVEPDDPLPFDKRLHLVAGQILQYRHMYKILPEVEQLAFDLGGKTK